MNREQLSFEDTPNTGRRLPITGRPFALMMSEIMSEGGTGRLLR